MRAALSRALKLFLNPARTLPTMPWSAPRSAWTWPGVLPLVVLLLGLWLFGIGEAGLINAGLGNTPWTVLAQGDAATVGWSRHLADDPPCPAPGTPPGDMTLLAAAAAPAAPHP